MITPPIHNPAEPETVLEHAASREERRTTGKAVAVIIALLVIIIATYQAWLRKTPILAGIIIPALIMVLYTAWVLYSAKRDKYKKYFLAESPTACTSLSEVIVSDGNSLSSIGRSGVKKSLTSFKSSDLPLYQNNYRNLTPSVKANILPTSVTKSRTNSEILIKLHRPVHKWTHKERRRRKKQLLGKPHNSTFNRHTREFKRSYTVY